MAEQLNITTEEHTVEINDTTGVIQINTEDAPSVVNIGIAGPQGEQGEPGPEGPAGISSFRSVHTFAIGGNISVAVGDTNFIPPFFFSKTAGQTSSIAKVRYQIHSGTNATIKIQVNELDTVDYVGLVATTTPAQTSGTANLMDNDEISIVVTGVTGLPTNLTVTIVIEHTL